MTPDATAMPAQIIADAILAAPGWARIGITAPREELRHAAALALARMICEETVDAGFSDDRQYLLGL